MTLFEGRHSMEIETQHFWCETTVEIPMCPAEPPYSKSRTELP